MSQTRDVDSTGIRLHRAQKPHSGVPHGVRNPKGEERGSNGHSLCVGGDEYIHTAPHTLTLA